MYKFNNFMAWGLTVGMVATFGIEAAEQGHELFITPGQDHVPHQDHRPFASRAQFTFLTSGVSSVTANQLLYEIPDSADAENDGVIRVRFPATMRAR